MSFQVEFEGKTHYISCGMHMPFWSDIDSGYCSHDLLWCEKCIPKYLRSLDLQETEWDKKENEEEPEYEIQINLTGDPIDISF